MSAPQARNDLYSFRSKCPDMRARILSVALLALLAGFVAWRLTRNDTPSPAVETQSDSTVSSPLAADPVRPRRVEPPVPIPAQAAETPAPTNAVQRLLSLISSNSMTLLKPEQLEAYLRDNHRSAGSLLGAFHTTGDRSFLNEAREKYPNDPRVAFAAASMPGDLPEEHRKWIENFKQSAPDNAAGEFLSAAEYFKSGQSNLALAE